MASRGQHWSARTVLRVVFYIPDGLFFHGGCEFLLIASAVQDTEGKAAHSLGVDHEGAVWEENKSLKNSLKTT